MSGSTCSSARCTGGRGIRGRGVLVHGLRHEGGLRRQSDGRAPLPLGASMVSYGLWATFRVNPVYDPRIYAFEEVLGVKFSLWSAQAYGILTPLSAVATACYNLVAIAIAVVAAGQRERGREQEVLNAVLISGACGFALYFVCPVVGPVVSFGPYYPDTLPTVPLHSTLLMAVGGAPRNGMPSLHTIWALLIRFSARESPSRRDAHCAPSSCSPCGRSSVPRDPTG